MTGIMLQLPLDNTLDVRQLFTHSFRFHVLKLLINQILQTAEMFLHQMHAKTILSHLK